MVALLRWLELYLRVPELRLGERLSSLLTPINASR
jgi:hypothetical protein